MKTCSGEEMSVKMLEGQLGCCQGVSRDELQCEQSPGKDLDLCPQGIQKLASPRHGCHDQNCVSKSHSG